MIIQNFEYTSASGNKSNRSIVILSDVSDKVLGIDYGELDEDAAAGFVADMAESLSAQKEELNCLLHHYDLEDKYRRFFPENMDFVVRETISV